MSQAIQTRVGIIGGSGLYQIDGIENLREETLETPFGAPSDKVLCGQLGAAEVFFIPRHGKGHVLSPSEINYRANIYALKALGAEWCISVSAVGSLHEDYAPGDIAIPDQIIDRTKGVRPSTFFEEGIVAHVSMADPYCPELTKVLYDVASARAVELETHVHRGGSFVCMEGPAFSTRAESELYRSWGAKLIGMTALPEAKLAREAELAYATMALVTDYDCWKQDEAAVDVQSVLAVMKRNSENAKKILVEVIPSLCKTKPSTMASEALKVAMVTQPDYISPATRERLAPLVKKYTARQ